MTGVSFDEFFGDVSPPPAAEPDDDRSALIGVATELGVDPEHLATAISYETSGKFSPSVRGGKAQQHLGLIQFGPEEQKRFGVRPDQSFKEQMFAVRDYLKARGLPPGADLLTLYKTINAGNPNASDEARDENATITEHVARMSDPANGHVAKAQAFLSRGTAQAASAPASAAGVSFEEFFGAAPAPGMAWTDIGSRILSSFAPTLRQAAGGLMRWWAENTPANQVGILIRADERLRKGPPEARTVENLQRVLQEETQNDPIVRYGRSMEAEASKELQALQPPGKWFESPKNLAFAAGQGLVQTAPAIAIGAATRSPAAGLAAMGTQVVGSKYGEQRREGRTPEQATRDATFWALAETVPETWPLKFLMAPGAKFAKRIGTTALAEGVQEVGTEVLELGYDKGILDKDMTWGEAVDRLAQAGVVGTAVGGVVATGAHPFIGREPPVSAAPEPEPAAAPPVSEPPAAAPPVASPVETPTPAPPRQGREAVFTARGTAVEVEPKIMEADSLVTSHTDDLAENQAYPGGLQARDRTRAGSEEQINSIAANLRPELLGPSALASEGAPIIGPDGVVESGNARVLAIRRAFAGRPQSAARYRTWLEGQGFSLAGFKNPILVRQRVTALDAKAREAFAREANERTTATMSTSEQAMTDAKVLSPAHIGLYKGGALTGGHNAPFVRAFLEAAVPVSERASLYTSEGGLSQAGAARIENALFAKAFEDAELLAALREDPDTNIKSIGGALTDAAPTWVQLRAEAATGKIQPHVDITPQVLEAVRIVRKARAEGQKVADLAGQTDIFKGVVSPEAKAVLRLMFKTDALTRPASRQDIAAALEFYATEARKQQPGPALLGEPVKPIDILELARQKREGGLFGEAAQQRAPDVLYAKAGAQHVGFAVPAASAPRRAVPIRRRDIIDKLVKAINQPLYTGRIKERTVLGFFRPRTRELRTKYPNDFESFSHELAHWLDSVFPEIRKQWLPGTKDNATVRAELSGVSYDASKLYEGFAEFMRLWMTQEHMLPSRAPHFTGWWEDFLARAVNPQIRDAIYVGKREMHDWLAMDPLDRLASRHGSDIVNRIHQIKHSLWDEMRQGLINATFGFERAEKRLWGAVRPGGMTQTARNAARAMSLIDGAFTKGFPVYHTTPFTRATGQVMPAGMMTFEGPGLYEILAPVAEDIDDFINFAVARSAYELKQQGRENLMPDDEIAAGLRLGQQNPAFVRVFEQEFQAWNRGIVQFGVDLGAIDPDKRANWGRQMYLPFWRATMPEGLGFQGKGAMPGEWRGIHRLTGGTGELRDILHNIFGNASMIIKAAVVNHARQVAIDDVMSNPNGGSILAPISGDSHPVVALTFSIKESILAGYEKELKAWAADEQAKGDLTTQQIENGVKDRRRDFEDAVENVFDLLRMASLTGISPKGAPNQKANAIAVLRRGKPHYYEVADELWLRSYMALNRPVKDVMWRALAVPARVYRALTTLSPNFMLRQIFRDPVTAWVLAKHKHKLFLSPARGLVRILGKDQVYQDWVANGGGFGRFVDDDVMAAHIRRRLQAFYTKKGINWRSVIDTPEKLAEALEAMGSAIENMSRLPEYANAVAAGAHPTEAVFLSGEITTDFVQRGDWWAIQNMMDAIPFLRPNILGPDRLIRAIASDNHRGKVMGKLLGTSMLVAGIAAWNFWNPLYDDLDDFDKDAYVHFFIPLPAYFDFVRKHGRRPKTPSEAKGLFWLDGVRMPKSYEVAVFWSLAERTTIEAIKVLGEQGKAGGDAAEDWLRGMWAALNTMFLPDVRVPQAVSGPFDIYVTNRDPLTGAPIVPEGEKNMPPSAQYGPGTSATGKIIGQSTRQLPQSLQISPRRFDHYWRSVLGTIGAMSLQAFDRLVDDTQPDLAVRRWPLAGVVLESQNAGRYPRLAAELIAEADGTYAAIKKYTMEGRQELADEQAKTIPAQRHLAAERVQSAMSALRNFMSNAVLASNLEMARMRAGQWAESGLASPEFRASLVREDVWSNIGALKAAMRDDITMVVREQSKRGYEALRSVGKQPVPLPGWRPTEHRTEP